MIKDLRILTAVFCLFLGSPSTALTQSWGPEKLSSSIENSGKEAKILKVKKVIHQQLTAWNQGNMQGFMEGYWKSDALQFITSKGITYGYNQVLNNYLKSYPNKEKMGVLSFEQLNVRFLDSLEQVAQVTGTWDVAHGNDHHSGTFSLIVSFFGTEPKIIIDHTF